MADEAVEEIRKEISKYGLKMTGAIKYKLGTALVYHVGAYGHLWESPTLKQLWDGNGGFQGMTDAMHNNLYFLAPETTSITIADPGDNKEGKTYLIFVFSSGG